MSYQVQLNHWSGDPDDERWVADLSNRYQRLFQEHSRLQTQHNALKKAMAQEQSENKTLAARVKENEQGQREALRELGTLKFHNERLTKRVENLQEALSQKGRGPWLTGSSSRKELEVANAALEVMKAELHARIEENEKLHNDVYEANNLYAQHVKELQEQLAGLQQSNQDLQAKLKSSKRSLGEARAGIQTEKCARDKALADAKQELERTKSLLQSETENVERELWAAKEELDRAKTKVTENGDKIQRYDGLLAELRQEQIAIVQLNAEIFGEMQTLFAKLIPPSVKEGETVNLPAKHPGEAAQAYLAILQAESWQAKIPDSQVICEQRRLYAEFARWLDNNRPQCVDRLAELIERLRAADAVPKERIVVEGEHPNLKTEHVSRRPTTRNEAADGTMDRGVQVDVSIPHAIAPLVGVAGTPVEVLRMNASQPQITEQPFFSSYSPSAAFQDSASLAAPPVELLEQGSSVQKKSETSKERLTQTEYARESLIKRHYEAKVNQLYEKIQTADSRAVRFYRAWQQVVEHSMLAKKERDDCQLELGTVKEELEHTQTTFQRQMDAMAEHVASLTARAPG